MGLPNQTNVIAQFDICIKFSIMILSKPTETKVCQGQGKLSKQPYKNNNSIKPRYTTTLIQLKDSKKKLK